MPAPALYCGVAQPATKFCHKRVSRLTISFGRVMRLFLRPLLVTCALLLALCAMTSPAPTAQAAERGSLGSVRGPLPEGATHPDAYPTSPNPYRQNSLHWSLFNATASCLACRV